jgi:hypothetical protein
LVGRFGWFVGWLAGLFVGRSIWLIAWLVGRFGWMIV